MEFNQLEAQIERLAKDRAKKRLQRCEDAIGRAISQFLEEENIYSPFTSNRGKVLLQWFVGNLSRNFSDLPEDLSNYILGLDESQIVEGLLSSFDAVKELFRQKEE